MVERLLIVSLNPDILKQKIVSATNALPGDRFTVTVLSVKPNGIKVELFKDIEGHITPLHVKNKPNKLWDKGFRKGTIFIKLKNKF